jgi:CheY-like chemotaxis protein
VLDAAFCESSEFTLTPGEYIEISVSDTGVGMTKEIVERVFEPFFTTKEVGKGTGLGMAAVYGTITDHHGSITIYSEPGVGSVFKIHLPLSLEKHVELCTEEELIHGSGGILLVDDEELIRVVGKDLLEKMGYRVYLADDGEQALEVYANEKNDISLVIMDMIMPKKGGKEALIALLEFDPSVRVLIASGFHQERIVDEIVSLGAVGFLQKPYHFVELSKSVSKAISTA